MPELLRSAAAQGAVLLEGLRNCECLTVNEKLAGAYENWIREHPADHGVWGVWPRCHPEMPVTEVLVQQAREASDQAVIVLNILNMVPGVFAAMLMPTILKRFDKFKTLFWCNIVCIVMGLVIYFLGYDNQGVFITPDCAEYGEYKSGISAKCITFAIQTFSVKITGAVSSSLALFLLGLFGWVSVEAESFEQLAAMNIQQSAGALNGLWIVYALIPVIGMIISTFFYLGYKLNDKDVQIMAKCNSGEITKEEAEKLLSRNY